VVYTVIIPSVVVHFRDYRGTAPSLVSTSPF
jgi:hypothetical protein